VGGEERGGEGGVGVEGGGGGWGMKVEKEGGREDGEAGEKRE